MGMVRLLAMMLVFLVGCVDVRAQEACRKAPAPPENSRCFGSPTHQFIESMCLAHPRAQLTRARPCSERYQVHWRMEFDESYLGMPVIEAFDRKYGSMVNWSSMYLGKEQNTPEMLESFTIGKGPGDIIALQRNIEPGIVPSQNTHFTNFPNGTEAICISVDLFVPKGYAGSKGSGKLGYGVWGGTPGKQPGGGVSPVKAEAWTIRNVRGGRIEHTALYGYHLNRGASQLWSDHDVNLERPTCDSSGCCLHGDTSNRAKIPHGRWVRIEQEVVANKPGEADGLARLWIDGKQQAEMTGLYFGDMPIRGLKINDMWGGPVERPAHHARRSENYWYANYTVYAP